MESNNDAYFRKFKVENAKAVGFDKNIGLIVSNRNSSITE